MNVWPVVQRELRAQARHRGTYWSRVYGGLLLVLVFAAVMGFAGEMDSARLGSVLFGNLHTVMVAAIWFITPLMTADCIARERREGTLGLLFLTPLTPAGVAVGKSLLHALRAASLLLVAVPVLCLPVMLGGVSWRDGVLALLLDGAGLLLALSLGLLASTFAVTWTRAVIGSVCLSALGFGFISLLCAGEFLLGLLSTMPGMGKVDWPPWPELLAGMCLGGAAGVSNIMGVWREIWTRFPPPAQDKLLLFAAGNSLLCAALAVGIVALSARRLRFLRTGERESPRRDRMARAFTLPRIAPGLFRKRQSKLLDRNPIVWLQGYSAMARSSKWMWCLLIVLGSIVPFVESLGPYSVFGQDAIEWGLALFLFLCLGISFTSSSSFRQERESGALELILVTPLTTAKLVAGRLEGIWRQFFPAVLVFGLFHYYCLSQAPREGVLPLFWIVLSTLLTMPMLGMLIGSAPGNWLSAWIGTYLLGVFSLVAPEAMMWFGAMGLHLWRTHEIDMNNELIQSVSQFWNATENRQIFRQFVLPFCSQWLLGLGALAWIYRRLRLRRLAVR